MIRIKLALILCAIGFALGVGGIFAQAEEPPRLEADYVERWCVGEGFTEGLQIRDENNDVAGYVDCYIDNGNSRYAIEFDFSHKWAEALGQSLWYSLETASKPAIALIHKSTTGDVAFARHYDNLTAVLASKSLPVTIICIGSDGNEKPCFSKKGE